VPSKGRLTAQTKTWGFDVSWSKQVLFNTRFDTATKPEHNLWTNPLAHCRCLVPTFGFFESHQSETCLNPRTGKQNKQRYYVSLPGQPLLFIAGVYEKDRFSLMTTEPNAVMRPIHHRMPVVLRLEELETWLSGDYLSLANRSAVDLVAAKDN
jgi:putative SOS response-associated peptidase YedK